MEDTHISRLRGGLDMSFHKFTDTDADVPNLPTLAVEIICEIVSYFSTIHYPYVPDSPPQPNPGLGPDSFPFGFSFPSPPPPPSYPPLDPLLQRTHVLKALSETCTELRDKCRPLFWENVVVGFRTKSNKSQSAERELVALIEFLTKNKDLGGCIHSLLLPLPQSTSPKTLHAFASLLVNDLVNLRTLQILGVTNPEFARILSTKTTSLHASLSSPSSSNASIALEPDSDQPISFPSLTSLLIDSSGHQFIRLCPNLVKVYVTFYTFECSNVGGYLSALGMGMGEGLNPFLFPFAGNGLHGYGYGYGGMDWMGDLESGERRQQHGGMGTGPGEGRAPVGPGPGPPPPRNARVRRLAEEMGLTRIPSFAYAFANANPAPAPGHGHGRGHVPVFAAPGITGLGLGPGGGGTAGQTTRGTPIPTPTPTPILTKEELERRRLRQVQLSVVRCIRESRIRTGQSQETGGEGGSSIEFFQVGNPGIDEDGGMWVVESDGDGEGDSDRYGRGQGVGGAVGVGVGVGGQRDDDSRTPSPLERKKPLEGSVIRAIVETMPNLRRFPRLYVHPDTPASVIPYILSNLPHLTYIHFHPSDPLDTRTIGFIGVLTSEMGVRAQQVYEGQDEGVGWDSDPDPYNGAHPHNDIRGYEYGYEYEYEYAHHRDGNGYHGGHGLPQDQRRRRRRGQPQCEIEMQYRENSMVLPISPPSVDYRREAQARRMHMRGTGTGTDTGTGNGTGGEGVDSVHMVNPFSMMGRGMGMGMGMGMEGLEFGGLGLGLGLGGNPYPNPHPNPFAHAVPHLMNIHIPIPVPVPAPVPVPPNIPAHVHAPVPAPVLVPVPVSMPIPGFDVRLPPLGLDVVSRTRVRSAEREGGREWASSSSLSLSSSSSSLSSPPVAALLPEDEDGDEHHRHSRHDGHQEWWN